MTETTKESQKQAQKVPFDQMTFHTTPNYLTVMRIAFVPGVVYSLFQGGFWWDFTGALLFTIAGITDWFDGWLARKHGIETVYGKLLDPLADKFLVISSLIMLEHMGRLSPVIVMVLVCRELTITGLRALASAEGVIVAASQGGKWKTFIQMFALPFIMLQEVWGFPIGTVGMGLLYISLAFSLWSAKDYIVEFFIGLKAATALRIQKRAEKKAAKKRKKEEKRRAKLLAAAQNSPVK